MSLILWLLQFAFNPLNITAVIIAIGISSILFTLVHFTFNQDGLIKTRASYVYLYIFGNIWVGIFGGWHFCCNYSTYIIPLIMVSDSKDETNGRNNEIMNYAL